MTITRLHLSITILIALTLHGGIAMWFVVPTPAPLPPPPAQPLRVSLLATVAETTVNTPTVIPEPPPKPVPVPQLRPKPVTQEAPPEKPAPKLEPTPPEPRPVKRDPEPVPAPEPMPEVALPTPPETSTVPLDAVATARYEQLLVAWLEKHKKYPRRAQRLRIEGEGMLRILIDRAGRTQQITLKQRTGNRLLDKAALEMAQRADPFPPIPDNDPRRELEFIVPVAFMLR